MVVAVLPNVHRLGSDRVNYYVVEEAGRVTVVDAGLSGYWPDLEPDLQAIGRTLDDIAALVLSHAHTDHTGVAGRLHARGVPVYLHPEDEELMRTGKQSKREGSPLPYLRRPAVWSFFIHMARNGGLKPARIEDTRPIADGDQLDLPGSPRILHTPGHTNGHCAIHFEGVGALFVGDLMCTWNPLSGRLGPQIMPSAFNISSAQCMASLDRIEDIEARALLPGHGEPWREGVRAAVARAREASPS